MGVVVMSVHALLAARYYLMYLIRRRDRVRKSMSTMMMGDIYYAAGVMQIVSSMSEWPSSLTSLSFLLYPSLDLIPRACQKSIRDEKLEVVHIFYILARYSGGVGGGEPEYIDSPFRFVVGYSVAGSGIIRMSVK